MQSYEAVQITMLRGGAGELKFTIGSSIILCRHV